MADPGTLDAAEVARQSTGKSEDAEMVATSTETDENSVTDEKPQAMLFHQLNLRANAVRRTADRSVAGRPEPLRLVKVVAEQA